MSIVGSIALKHGAALELRSPLADGSTGLEVRLSFAESPPSAGGDGFFSR